MHDQHVGVPNDHETITVALENVLKSLDGSLDRKLKKLKKKKDSFFLLEIMHAD